MAGRVRGQLPADFLAGLSDEIERRTERWRSLISEPTDVSLLVADSVDGELCGFAMFGHAREEGVPVTTGEVWAINLHADAWGTGIGSALFDATTESLRTQGYQAAMLWVLDTNRRARRFYEKHGWRADGGVKTDEHGGAVLHLVRYSRSL